MENFYAHNISVSYVYVANNNGQLDKGATILMPDGLDDNKNHGYGLSNVINTARNNPSLDVILYIDKCNIKDLVYDTFRHSILPDNLSIMNVSALMQEFTEEALRKNIPQDMIDKFKAFYNTAIRFSKGALVGNLVKLMASVVNRGFISDLNIIWPNFIDGINNESDFFKRINANANNNSIICFNDSLPFIYIGSNFDVVTLIQSIVNIPKEYRNKYEDYFNEPNVLNDTKKYDLMHRRMRDLNIIKNDTAMMILAESKCIDMTNDLRSVLYYLHNISDPLKISAEARKIFFSDIIYSECYSESDNLQSFDLSQIRNANIINYNMRSWLPGIQPSVHKFEGTKYAYNNENIGKYYSLIDLANGIQPKQFGCVNIYKQDQYTQTDAFKEVQVISTQTASIEKSKKQNKAKNGCGLWF